VNAVPTSSPGSKLATAMLGANPPLTPGSGGASRAVVSDLDEAPNRRLSVLTKPTLAD
jgi:hypothetical protein